MLFDSFNFRSCQVDRFFPANSCKFPLTSFPDPFHWIQQTVGMILSLQIRSPSHTGTQLWGRQFIRTVVCFKANNLAIQNMRDQQASSTTVMSRAANPYLLNGSGFLAFIRLTLFGDHFCWYIWQIMVILDWLTEGDSYLYDFYTRRNFLKVGIGYQIQ